MFIFARGPWLLYVAIVSKLVSFRWYGVLCARFGRQKKSRKYEWLGESVMLILELVAYLGVRVSQVYVDRMHTV